MTPAKLQKDVPQLMSDTWILNVTGMPTDQIFHGTQKTRTVSCTPGSASINPEYSLQRLADLARPDSQQGIPVEKFAAWYDSLGQFVRRLRREVHLEERRSPWLVRGLRLVVVGGDA